MKSYKWAHDDQVDLEVTIDWSVPVTHDMLNYGLATSDDSAYFYSIIGLINKEWWVYYIGMVFSQSVSKRQKNPDHKRRLDELKMLYPEVTWHITLGTPNFNKYKIEKGLIQEIEGLLIYSHWHEEIINKAKIDYFISENAIQITNTGFIDPFYEKIGHGVFCS